MRPHLTFSVVGELHKSTNTDRIKLGELHFAVGAEKDFQFETELQAGDVVPVFMGSVLIAEFLVIQVTGGDCKATLKVGDATLALQVNVGLVLAGTACQVIEVSSEGGCRVLIYGASK